MEKCLEKVLGFLIILFLTSVLFGLNKIPTEVVFAYQNSSYNYLNINNSTYLIYSDASGYENVNDIINLIPNNSTIIFDDGVVLSDTINIDNKNLVLSGNLNCNLDLAIKITNNSEVKFNTFIINGAVKTVANIETNSSLLISNSNLYSEETTIVNNGILKINSGSVISNSKKLPAIYNLGNIYLENTPAIKSSSICDIKTTKPVFAMNKVAYCGEIIRIYYEGLIDLSKNISVVSYVDEEHSKYFVLSNPNYTLKHYALNMYIITGESPVINASFINENNSLLDCQYFIYSGYVKEPEIETPLGKVFLGWYDDNNEKFNFLTEISENINLYAKFETCVNTFNYKINSDENGDFVIALYTSSLGNVEYYLDSNGNITNEICYVENAINVIDLNRKIENEYKDCKIEIISNKNKITFNNLKYSVSGILFNQNLVFNENSNIHFCNCVINCSNSNIVNYGNLYFENCIFTNLDLTNYGSSKISFSTLNESKIKNVGNMKINDSTLSGDVDNSTYSKNLTTNLLSICNSEISGKVENNSTLNLVSTKIISNDFCIKNSGTLYLGGNCSFVGNNYEIETNKAIYATDIENLIGYCGSNIRINFSSKLDNAILNVTNENYNLFNTCEDNIEFIYNDLSNCINLVFYYKILINCNETALSFKVKENSLLSEIHMPDLENYSFIGFLLNGNLINAKEYKVTEDLTLTASYKPNLIENVEICDTTVDYNSEFQSFNIKGLGSKDIVYYFVDGKYITTKPTFKNAGTYDVIVKIERDNYFDLILKDKFTIDKVNYNKEIETIFENNKVILNNLDLQDAIISYSLSLNSEYVKNLPNLKEGNNLVYLKIETPNFNTIYSSMFIYYVNENDDPENLGGLDIISDENIKFTVLCLFLVTSFIVNSVYIYINDKKFTNKKIRIIDFDNDKEKK